MRALLTTAALVVAVAFLDTSVSPWMPILARVPIVGMVTTAFIVVRPQTSAYVWFAIAATLVADALVGAPVGTRAALFLAAFLALQPLIRSFRVDPRASIILAIGGTLAFVDAIGTAIAADAFPTLRQWTALLVGWWWSAAVNVLVGYLAFRIMRRMASR